MDSTSKWKGAAQYAALLFTINFKKEPQMPTLVILSLVIWEVYWKGKALWCAAQKKDKFFFVAILLINSLGILPIYYLYKNKYFK